jgi:hypothetical protein
MNDNAVVGWKGLLKEYGWPYSRTHTWRMMAEKRFPECFKPPGAHRNSHPMWWRREIDAYFVSLRT